MTSSLSNGSSNAARYGWFLLFIAGLGGLLYGVDVGIIAAALLYLGKTISLTVAQTSLIVAAVLGGSMISSLVAGAFADWLGRKRMIILSGLLFIISIGLIVVSQSFLSLFVGRLLQGMSGGVIGVVVPLYLAECLNPKKRGRGTAFFQLLLTIGVVIAAFTGLFYTHQAQHAIAAAGGNASLILAAENHAWRGMFLTVIYPGVVFFAGCFFLSESPRWLFRQGRKAEALAALRRSSSEEEAALEMTEMEAAAGGAPAGASARAPSSAIGSLFKRKYIYPFLLACAILALTQSTGINSVLAFLVVILKHAGMDPQHATDADVAVKTLQVIMTLVAMVLVDRKGRKFLLKWGTGGVVVALFAAALIFHGFESRRVDVKAKIEAARRGNIVTMPVNAATMGSPSRQDRGRAMELTVLYSYGNGEKIASVLTDGPKPVLKIAPENSESGRKLTINRAVYGAVPAERTGWFIAACLALYIAMYSVGPGVVVWLALSELMPTRIRSNGMGIAMLVNQGVSTGSAAVFLPVVGNYGYYAMFAVWGGATVIYFLIAVFILPETKGKTLEEIETYFEKRPAEALT